MQYTKESFKVPNATCSRKEQAPRRHSGSRVFRCPLGWAGGWARGVAWPALPFLPEVAPANGALATPTSTRG